MANIYAVAKEAKVSTATVSAVVNGTAYVSPALKARVEAAVRKLGYQPNLLARSLAKQRSHMLGVIVPDIANPFWPDVVRGAEDAAHAAGYTLILSNTDNDPRKEELYVRLFLAKRVDGLILAKAPGRLGREMSALLAGSRVPIVKLFRARSDFPGDAVVLDDRDAAFEAVSHLIRLGHRRSGMIAGVGEVTTGRRRTQGYRDALEQAGLDFVPDLLRPGDYRVESGYAGGLDLLKLKPDAVFISNYLMAVGFMKALRQYRLRCPQDVAIVTCDDHPWLDSFSPRLTTVNFPKYTAGAEAARVLVERLADRKRPSQTIELRSSLTIRDSCGAGLRGGQTEA